MDMLTNIIIADVDELEALGESVMPVENWRGITTRGVDLVKIATLHALIAGDAFDDTLTEYDHVYAATEEGPWVVQVPAAMTELLAQASDDALEAIGEELAASEEFETGGWPVEEVHTLIAELAELAHISVAQNKAMFIWMSQSPL